MEYMTSQLSSASQPAYSQLEQIHFSQTAWLCILFWWNDSASHSHHKMQVKRLITFTLLKRTLIPPYFTIILVSKSLLLKLRVVFPPVHSYPADFFF